jgi:hypothetical protein
VAQHVRRYQLGKTLGRSGPNLRRRPRPRAAVPVKGIPKREELRSSALVATAGKQGRDHRDQEGKQESANQHEIPSSENSTSFLICSRDLRRLLRIMSDFAYVVARPTRSAQEVRSKLRGGAKEAGARATCQKFYSFRQQKAG